MSKTLRSLLSIGIALLAALAAVLLAARWSARSTIDTRHIAVAAAEIQPGTRLRPDMLQLLPWPASSLPPGIYTELSVLDGRVTRVALARGEPVQDARLAQPGATGGLSALVAHGKRAMTVRVNDVVGVAGFALPGNFVDILVSTQEERRAAGERELTISKVVLERILVLAVAQEAGQGDTRPKVVNAVTLEVTPAEAEQLDLARSVGQLSLVLRNQVDLAPARTVGATKQTLLKTAAPAPVVKAAPSAPRSERPMPAQQCQQVFTGAGALVQCF
jgi:pilus assembly protein CpaB